MCQNDSHGVQIAHPSTPRRPQPVESLRPRRHTRGSPARQQPAPRRHTGPQLERAAESTRPLPVITSNLSKRSTCQCIWHRQIVCERTNSGKSLSVSPDSVMFCPPAVVFVVLNANHPSAFAVFNAGRTTDRVCHVLQYLLEFHIQISGRIPQIY